MRSVSARVAPTALDAPTVDVPAAGVGPDVSASPTFEVRAGGTLSIGVSTRSGSNGTRAATASGRAPPEAPDPSRLYADRYRLVGLLAGGGNGEVWAADDTVTNARVALKRIRTLSPAEIGAVRREVAALRWLRLPGVVQLRDEGETGREYYVVMDLVDGKPFLQRGPLGWDAIREPVLDLLEVLGGVHLAGVLHLDLKPANVYLGDDGRPVILDFGLASGVAIASGQARPRGATIRYAAPEQLAVQPCDARTDLYAVGVMLYEALSGAPPHGLGGWEEVAGRRVGGSARPLASVAPGVPAAVAQVVDRLLAPRPEDRPASAQEVVRLLGGRALFEPEGLPAGDASGPAELRGLFAGPDLFLHLREDAAALLFERTGGVRARVAEELGAWLRAGLARREAGRLLVDRGAIERLRGGLRLGSAAGPAPAEDGDAERVLRRLIATRAPGPAIVRAARDAAAAMSRDGRLAPAAAALDLGLAVARQENDVPAERALLEEKAVVALGMESVPALDRLLPELTRAVDAGVPVEPLRALVEGALLTLTGQERRALALVEKLAPFEQEELEVWRQAKRALAARRISADDGEGVLVGLADWAAACPDRAARVAGWWGNLRYQQARYAESAALHLERAEVCLGSVRVSARVSAGYALLEAGRFDEAVAVVDVARAEAREARHAVFEARAELLLRNVAWRAGRPLAPRPELVDAAAALGVPWIEGAFALQEGAAAWRSGDAALAHALARRAIDGFGRARAVPARLLARALAHACAGEPDEALVADALACPVDAVAVQALGLVRLRGGALPAPVAAALAERAATRPRSAWAERLEVLSFDEALGRVPVPSATRSPPMLSPAPRVRYRSLLRALFDGPNLPPPLAASSGAQIYDGTCSVRDVGSGGDTAEGYASPSGTVITEEWVYFDTGSWLNGTTEWRRSGTDNALPAARLAAIKAMPGASGFRYAKFDCEYKSLPSAAAVAALPAANPAGITTYSYKLHGLLPSGQIGVTAELHRERRSLAGGRYRHTDHWVFRPDYRYPASGLTNKLYPFTSVTRPTTLKAFLEGQLAIAGGGAGWRYSQVDYVMGALP